jgi:hypothetical protein
MQIGYTGDDGQVGSKMLWVSEHSEVGNGTQTITGIDGKDRVNFDVEFDGKGSAKSYFLLRGGSTQCKVNGHRHSSTLSNECSYGFNDEQKSDG